MGSITESFSHLNDHLAGQFKKNTKHSAQVDLLKSKVLAPLMPSGIRFGSGTVTDIKDRQVGPFDIIATRDGFPAFGDGSAATYLAEGVVFALEVRDWKENDLTQFGEMAQRLKSLERKKKNPIPCLAVSFDPLPLAEIRSFLAGRTGQGVDGILSIGHHIVLRNAQGLYGNPTRVAYVTENPGPEALKAFSFYLLHLTQAALNQTFSLADYQHL